jgi:hypothetical protein
VSGIGWYVHHHGHGHATRFAAIRPHLDAPVVVFSSLPAPDRLPERTTWVVLPRDDDEYAVGGVVQDPREADPTVGGLLHWAPRGHRGHRRRLAMIAQACAERELGAFVVDVSVEVALWVRMLGVPTVVMAQPGDRTDEPHSLAYRAADRILAPWPDRMVPSAALEEFRGRVVWVGGVSRFDGRERTAGPVGRSLLVLGRVGSDDAVAAACEEAADAGWSPTVVGADAAAWAADPWDLLCASEVVVSAAGQNSIADLAAVGARALVIPQDRPFDEQRSTADALQHLRLAVVEREMPRAGRVAGLLERASELRPDWRAWGVTGGAERAAAVIGAVVG